MASLFGAPKVPKPLPTPDPADTQNRINSALVRSLQAGGSSADQTSAPGVTAATSAARPPTLTGLS